MERLQKYIASSGYTSRRKAEDLIREGRVSVNGQVVTELGTKVKSGDVVLIDGEAIVDENKVYEMYYIFFTNHKDVFVH
jgi:23S rRNA pseudouridine2605 synthase